ncbi:bacteriocin [Granulicella sibirica]|uniref:Uncharacterized protein n=1 Tax=Granulicella sibirica TaxID=2479048 RepID=A0A4Q0SXY2_9BACT|nr:bacteriocin [Granulicella sibirica]RXH54309.1 hypothetical protein GRAN_4605 [Granulicella sibirica]
MSQHISEEPKKPVTSTPKDELNENELETVSGGINPQPLPPFHKED